MAEGENYGSVQVSKITLRILNCVSCVLCSCLHLNFVYKPFFKANANNRHIFQEFKNRIMGKKNNLSGILA